MYTFKFELFVKKNDKTIIQNFYFVHTTQSVKNQKTTPKNTFQDEKHCDQASLHTLKKKKNSKKLQF